VALFGPLQSLFVALQGDGDPSSIAAGFALGASLGLLPSGNLIAAFILVLLFFFRVDKSMAVFAGVLFSPIGFLLDPLAHRVGAAVLTAGALQGAWTALYNLPIVPWTRFNNTVVMGQLLFGLLLYYPLYRLGLSGVYAYRARWKAKVDRWPVMRTINGWGWVQKLQRWNKTYRELR
jgi:uncharacterized protein (TIGR03546 family)